MLGAADRYQAYRQVLPESVLPSALISTDDRLCARDIRGWSSPVRAGLRGSIPDAVDASGLAIGSLALSSSIGSLIESRIALHTEAAVRNAGGSVTSSARDSSGVSMLRAAQLDSVHMVAIIAAVCP
ncbi:hypothetical protein POSPLADRAFT_1054579 [Postia placenta MAD-698-R-SB12]|uniref:Uncharacterized protein n=1 Tax=Postia placenta MAD-698-R-SB12 TaxID=670580 RepID=A0A1X6N6B8_9APHY|nr:hypothetical protein POSPLADRAFT_1054579 [Postia placenta MAD-698-R-SB12]OSX63953.1 hypothetical protein POSPLADRAFT_1054579 [Postia placenta MAD-698-R-SB12]